MWIVRQTTAPPLPLWIYILLLLIVLLLLWMMMAPKGSRRIRQKRSIFRIK